MTERTKRGPRRLIALAVGLVMAATAMVATAPEAEASTGQQHCVTNLGWHGHLNLRSGPSTGYHVVARIPAQTCSIVQLGPATHDGWIPVQYNTEHYGYSGWAHGYYLRAVNNHPIVLPVHTPAYHTHHVTSGVRHCVQAPSTLKLRTGPTTHYRILAHVPTGNCNVTTVGLGSGQWLKVRWTDDHHRTHEGWMHSAYLRRWHAPIVVHPPVIHPVPVLDAPYCVTGLGWGGTLNMRSGPGTGYHVVDQLTNNTCVRAVAGVATHYGWRKVAVHRHGHWVVGWVAGNYLRTGYSW